MSHDVNKQLVEFLCRIVDLEYKLSLAKAMLAREANFRGKMIEGGSDYPCDGINHP